MLLLRVEFGPSQFRLFFQAVILNASAAGSPLQRRLELLYIYVSLLSSGDVKR